MSVLGQMEALIGNQERKLNMWEFTGLWWLQDQIKYKAQKGDSVWLSNLIASLHCVHLIEQKLNPGRLLVAKVTLIISI